MRSPLTPMSERRAGVPAPVEHLAAAHEQVELRSGRAAGRQRRHRGTRRHHPCDRCPHSLLPRARRPNASLYCRPRRHPDAVRMSFAYLPSRPSSPEPARGLFDAHEYARQRAFFTTRAGADAAGVAAGAGGLARPRRAAGEGRDQPVRPAGLQEPGRRVRGGRARPRAATLDRRDDPGLRQRRQSRPRGGARGPRRPVSRATHLPRRRRRAGAGRGDRRRRAPTSCAWPAPTTTPCAWPPHTPPPPAGWSCRTRRGPATSRSRTTSCSATRG